MLLTVISTFFPHKNQELGFKPHDGMRVYDRLMPYNKEEGSRSQEDSGWILSFRELIPQRKVLGHIYKYKEAVVSDQ